MSTSANTKPLRGAQARQAVLDAAGAAFLADGFRKTSIESIARAAGVSRPTVYAHFADKEDIFRTIVALLHDEQFTAMKDAVAPDGPVAQRLHAALLARFAPFVAVTSSSAHGAELLDENSRVCGDITRASRQRSLRVLEQVLNDGEQSGELDLAAVDLSAAQASRVVYDAARGAKEDASVTPAAFKRNLQRLVAVLLRGLAR